MSGIVTRKPLVGFASAVIFFFLGLLLIQMETAPDAPKGLVIWMFRVLGWFLLFASIGSLVVAAAGVVQRRREQGLKREDRT